MAQAVAQPGRLSDSGAIELLNLVTEETKGEFEIHEEVGRGGMAVVYRATEVHLNRQVAIKVLPPELTFGKGAIERFRREAKTAAALDHPNIIPIYRIASTGRLFWYAMKFLEGRSLAEVLVERGQLTVTESVAILEQVADALDYAHQRGVVHRDIKPGNVMLDARGRVIVTDFGIAKELQQGAALTGSGNILGTPYYMSPEQCRGTELTGAADQYSLAIMAYQMIAGQLPFDADSAIDLLHKHCIETPPPIDTVLPGLPRHVTNALNRAMAKKPADRFPSVASFVNGLKGEDTNETTTTIVLHKRPSLSQRLGQLATESLPRGRNRRIGIAAGIAVLAVAGVAAAVMLKSGAAENQRPTTTALAPVAAESLRAAAPAADTTPASRPAVDTAPPPASPAPTAARTTRRTTASPTRTTATPPATPQRLTSDTTARAPAAPAPAPAAAPAPARPAPTARRGFLRVSVAGGYATISVNGERKTDGIAWADSVPAGRVTVSIARAGFQPQTRTVTLRAGGSQNVAFTMRQATP